MTPANLQAEQRPLPPATSSSLPLFAEPRGAGGRSDSPANCDTNPLHTASADRSHNFSHTWLVRGGPEGDLMELNGWSSPQMLLLYGASARSARARRTYDRVMEDS
jgi:hypothetical protein